jgi:hypothetical protein
MMNHKTFKRYIKNEYKRLFYSTNISDYFLIKESSWDDSWEEYHSKIYQCDDIYYYFKITDGLFKYIQCVSNKTDDFNTRGNKYYYIHNNVFLSIIFNHKLYKFVKKISSYVKFKALENDTDLPINNKLLLRKMKIENIKKKI